MKRTEKVLLLIVFIGLILKYLHVPGSSAILILSPSSLSLFYMYFSFAFFNGIELKKVFKKQSYQGIGKMRIIGAIGTGVGLSVGAIGILFKLSTWPGSYVQLLTSLLALALVVIVSFYKLNKSQSAVYLKILKRAVPVLAICICLVYIPSEIWLNMRYSNHPDYVKALLESEANPSNEDLWLKVEEEREKMMQNE